MLEQKIQKKILDNLKALDIYAYKNISTNRKGIPDIIACYGGRFIAIEVKAKGGKPTKLQELNLRQIRESGGVAILAYSWEDVAKVLKELQ